MAAGGFWIHAIAHVDPLLPQLAERDLRLVRPQGDLSFYLLGTQLLNHDLGREGWEGGRRGGGGRTPRGSGGKGRGGGGQQGVLKHDLGGGGQQGVT